ncbi:short-chain dehydrogenase/reductase [Pseudomonas fluorescens]|uniref:Short-chain dehydrogenase/reductase n=1 Tax=Pseudomonas fluorescens TaxID=294 RepID=A0A1T2YIK7_PSEFL|nr:SDR family NAD(P)-dependent oxidoreductase [Pseudomonas fluorescens]OPA91739.1 short-chain dehydrogenase/reductase [Pseudomonas fluorescens]
MPNVWFITGSSRGLGRAITEAALRAGDRVAATARNTRQLDDLVAEFGDAVFPLALDVTDNKQVVQAVEAAAAQFGRLDVVVNNAGYGDVASVEDVTPEDFKAQIDTNFYGVVNVSKAVVPVLRRQGSGHIIQVSSLGGRIGMPGLAAYQSAKWAVGGFSTVLAQEVGPLGVQVTVLEPGGMRTDWSGSSMTIPPISEPYQQTVGALVQLIGSPGILPTAPARVAEIVLELALSKDAPLRLLIGADAVQYAARAAEDLAASDKKWHDLSVSASD